MEDEFDLDDIIDEALVGAAASGTLVSTAEITRSLELDHRVALSSHRWSENDEGLLFQHDSQFVPGDVVAMRSAAVRQLARLTTDPPKNVNRSQSLQRAAQLTQLVYAARPFWLPQSTAWGVMAMKPLTDEDRAELLLPSPALITFSSPMEISAPYVGTDLDIVARLNQAHDLDPDAPSHLVSDKAEDHAPIHVRGGTLAILRYYSQLTKADLGDPTDPLFGYQLIGAIVAPSADGTLSNAVIWLLRRINPNVGATSRQVLQGQGLTVSASSGTFSLVEGRLDRSLLQPVAEALAAVVAWGSWTAPDPYSVPIELGKGFRKQSRKSAFKRAEARGQIAGVHVLAAREPSVRYATEPTSSGRTVAPHYRVGHWQRYRVGTRTNWTYERRRKQPVIVNAGAEDPENQVRIYRLPPPPPEWLSDGS